MLLPRRLLILTCMKGLILRPPILLPDSILRSVTAAGMVMEEDMADIMAAIKDIHSASAGLASEDR